jgi:hypothetical protein
MGRLFIAISSSAVSRRQRRRLLPRWKYHEHRLVLLRRVAKRISAVVNQLLTEFRILDCFRNLLGEFVDDFLRGARGRHQPVPGQHLVFWIAGLRDGRDVLGKHRALFARHRKHAHIAGFGLRQGI